MTHSSTLPPIEALLAVKAAHEAGSFSGAADELDLTHGAISRRVGLVERWAGAEIFERHGRGVRLTVAGQRLLGIVDQALSLLRAAPVRPRGERRLEIVRVSLLPSFARLWLLPNLAALEGRPPDLRVEIDLDHRFAPLESVDIAIRYGTGAWPDGNASPLFAETLMPVAPPAIAQALGRSPSIEAIMDYPLIHDAFPDTWRAWLAAHGHTYRQRAQDRIFADYDIVLQAAAAGCGVAILRNPFGTATAERLGLQSLGFETVANPSGFHLVLGSGAKQDGARRLVERVTRLVAVSTSAGP